ncbi:MAG: arsenate reductase ArsC [Pyrinomonadaceae bacterium]|nr:arsenate reductase ArsC [Pyrinomonadaceae bacterium]
MSERKKILILCTGNSARSQMAEGLLKHITQNRYDVYSAGTKPSIVRPEAIKVLAEIGIDISQNRSKSVDEFVNEEIDYVLTVCDNAKETCPYFPAKTRVIHHSFDDPPAVGEADEETTIEIFRRVRDEIEKYFRQAIKDKVFD